MAASKQPKRFAPNDLDNDNIAAGAAIATSKLADAANFILRGGSVAFTGDQSMGGSKLTNIGTPTPGSNDAARIVDVENKIAELRSIFKPKGSAKAAATGNVNISNPGTAIFDSITLTGGTHRLFLNFQTDPAENGIWDFNGSSSALTRIAEMNAWAEVPGAFVIVEQGATYGDTIWLCTSNEGGTLGTTAITWQQIPTTGLTASNFVFNETPSGTVNGSNTTFTLAYTPTSGTVRLYIEGWRLYPGSGNDYTISGSTITMAAAPLTGERLTADYMK